MIPDMMAVMVVIVVIVDILTTCSLPRKFLVFFFLFSQLLFCFLQFSCKDSFLKTKKIVLQDLIQHNLVVPYQSLPRLYK